MPHATETDREGRLTLEQDRPNGPETVVLMVRHHSAETHEVNENSNDQIKTVAAMYREIARAANCAVLLVHRQAAAGDQRRPRRQYEHCSGRQCTRRGGARGPDVPEDQRHLYLRLDDAKANLGLTNPNPQWYRRVSVTLPNNDEVGVLVPDALQRTSGAVAAETQIQILRLVEERWNQGNPFSPAIPPVAMAF